MNARLAKIEATVEGYKLLLAIIVSVMIGGFAFLGVQVTRLEGKITQIEGKISQVSSEVEALPGRINSSLTDLTRTLAGAITAAKQTPPQVILMAPPAARSGSDTPPTDK